MCVSLAQAQFSRTTVYAGEAQIDGRTIHVLGYENTARHLAASQHPRSLIARLFPSLGPAAGNAMLLHFPAVPGSMSEKNVLSTKGCPQVLRDMVRALEPPALSFRERAVAAGPTAARGRVEVFESGIYTVVLAEHAGDIPGALGRVPAAKRPPLNSELFHWYEKMFPAWPVALCCFNNVDTVQATPMMWWYEPQDPTQLFAPAIDSHTGGIPDLSALVKADHRVVFGSWQLEHGHRVRYSHDNADVGAYLPRQVIGTRVAGLGANGDFFASVDNVRNGRPIYRRTATSRLLKKA